MDASEWKVKILRSSSWSRFLVIDTGVINSEFEEVLLVSDSYKPEVPRMSFALPLYNTSFGDRFVTNWRGKLKALPANLDHRGGSGKTITWSDGIPYDELLEAEDDAFTRVLDVIEDLAFGVPREKITNFLKSAMISCNDVDPRFLVASTRTLVRNVIVELADSDSVCAEMLKSLESGAENVLPFDKFLETTTISEIVRRIDSGEFINKSYSQNHEAELLKKIVGVFKR